MRLYNIWKGRNNNGNFLFAHKPSSSILFASSNSLTYSIINSMQITSKTVPNHSLLLKHQIHCTNYMLDNVNNPWYPSGTCQSTKKIWGHVWYKLCFTFSRIYLNFMKIMLRLNIFFSKQNKHTFGNITTLKVKLVY